MKSADRVEQKAQKLSRGRGMCLGNVPLGGELISFGITVSMVFYNFFNTVRFFSFSPPSNHIELARHHCNSRVLSFMFV